jgi:hypothetical protein
VDRVRLAVQVVVVWFQLFQMDYFRDAQQVDEVVAV